MSELFPPSPPTGPLPFEACYRHADRRAGVSCQRCERPICPDCMISASVGFQCPQCARVAPQRVLRPAARWSAGATMVRPLVTTALLVVNVALFAVDLGRSLRLDGALFGRAFSVRSGEVVGVAEGDWWRLVSAGFLHVNLIHLGLNMFALWTLGRVLELELGRVRFAALYVASLLAGSFGVLLLDPGQPTVGASGAIFGAFGAMVFYQLSRGQSPLDSGLALMLGLNLLFTFTIPGISIGGHLGGLLGGIACGAALFGWSPRQRTPAPAVGLAACAVVAVVSVGGALAVAGGTGLFGS